MIDKLREDLKQAMLSHDEISVSTLRLLLSELKNAQIQKNVEVLSDSDIISVIQKEVKKRKEAAESFKQGGRTESAEKEEAELKVLEKYLPEQMSDEELTKIVEASITELGAASLSDMGKVIGSVMGKVGQSVEGARVSQMVRGKLSNG